MKMSPIKKIVIGLAVITVALSLITANNMASVMLIVASREAGSAAQQSVQTNAPVQNQTNTNTNNSQGGTSSNDTAVNNTATDNTAPTNTATDNSASNNTSTDNTAGDKTPADDKGSADNSGSSTGKNDKASIVEEFNKAVNTVKSGAKTVEQKGVTNYLAGQTTISGGISSIYNMLGGDEWLDGMLKDNSQGAATYTGADITAKFPVEGQTWSSKLTAADVKEASRSEKDGVITITITTIADAKSDSVKVGEGHAPKAFNVILPGVVNDNIPGIAKNMVGTASMAYPESTVKVTIDAKTGHVITADYDLKWTINFDTMGIVLPFGTKAEYTVAY